MVVNGATTVVHYWAVVTDKYGHVKEASKVKSNESFVTSTASGRTWGRKSRRLFQSCGTRRTYENQMRANNRLASTETEVNTFFVFVAANGSLSRTNIVFVLPRAAVC